MNFYSRPFFSVTVEFKTIDIISAIEMGAECIYIVDLNGKYTNQAIVKSLFYKIWNNDYSCIMYVPAINDNYDIKEQLTSLVASKKVVEEFPLVDRNKKIIGSFGISEFIHDEAKLEWIINQNFREDIIRNYRKVYLSTLEHEEIFSFYKACVNIFPLVPLSQGDLQNALEDEDCLLVYIYDIFPKKTKKISIYDLWKKNYTLEIDKFLKGVTISSKPAIIDKNEVGCRDKIIRKFDEGYETIAVIDDNKKFFGSICLSTYARYFPKKIFPIWNNLFINDEFNKENIRRKVSELCYGTSRREVPIIAQGNVVATCHKEDTSIHIKMRPYWEIVKDKTIKKYLKDVKKILISSEGGLLEGFKPRFDHMFSIEVYNDNLLQNYLIGDYDLLIYSADVWCNAPIKKININIFYNALLMMEVFYYLKENGINFYYLYLNNKSSDINQHIRMSDIVTNTECIFAGENNDYMVVSDVCNSDIVNVVSGRRVVVNAPTDYKKTIYIFGPCTAFSTFANDENSFASKLQDFFNQNGIKWKVVNCGVPTGGPYQGINDLYYIMDTPFKSGSYILYMGSVGLEYFRSINDDWLFDLTSIVDKRENMFEKMFHDFLSPHLNEKGNELLAEYFYRKFADAGGGDNGDKDILPPMFEQYSIKRDINRNEGDVYLLRWLNSLSQYRTPYKNIGAIVMNCNPFTKGHLHLIKSSLLQVDFLYVFVVEEDASEFSFSDRFNMAKSNCAKMSNVLVLSSGKYMISKFTFAEYFSKSKLQECNVYPAQDVQLFGRYIAPYFHINKRFVGSEPLDKVTSQYNEIMKEILPKYKVEVVEIPRVKLNNKKGEYINATTVRKLLKDGDLKRCKEYLTPISYEYITKNVRI